MSVAQNARSLLLGNVTVRVHIVKRDCPVGVSLSLLVVRCALRAVALGLALRVVIVRRAVAPKRTGSALVCVLATIVLRQFFQ